MFIFCLIMIFISASLVAVSLTILIMEILKARRINKVTSDLEKALKAYSTYSADYCDKE